MVERKRTQVIVLGELEISGLKIVRKRLSLPEASIRIFNKNVIIYPALDVKKIILRTIIKYKEATTKWGEPNFYFSVEQNGKIIKESEAIQKDIYAHFDELSSLLDIEIDLEKYNYKNIELNAFLKCWLETRSWKAEPNEKSEIISAETETKIKINFDAPEISLDIFPTHSPGKDLKTVDANADWGNPYFLNLHLNNKTSEIIETPGSFNLFENNKNIKDAVIKENLAPEQKTMIISDKAKYGTATWILEKGPEDWSWYEQDKKDKNKFAPKKELNKIYKYYATGDLKSETSHWENLESNHLIVNVRMPDYKLKALDVYNAVIGVKDLWNEFVAILGVTGGPGSIKDAVDALKVGKWKLGFAALVWAVELVLGTEAINKNADDVLSELMWAMNDPPELVKNYKILEKVKINKRRDLSATMFNISNLLKVCRLTNYKYWTARLKSDEKTSKKQSVALRKHKIMLSRDLYSLEKQIAAFSNHTERVKTLSKYDLSDLRAARVSNKQVTLLKKINYFVIKNEKTFKKSFYRFITFVKQIPES
ncbi:MAG: hypothetical protein HY438_01800 [DPANN group archaeon]|nr:hypothetical protein [DPANN group archaeon]